MIVLNRNIRFSHPDWTYTGTTYTEFLFGSIGLKVNADIRIDVKWSVEAVNLKYTVTANTIELLTGGSFITAGFKVGDTVVITGTASNNMTTTITVLTDSLMTVAGALANETVVSNIFGETPITSIDFYPNLVSNDSPLSLFNLTDRETIPRYYADTITTDAANPTVMKLGTNSRGWVTPADAATIYRLSFTNHIQTFVISHTFNITPIFLANQLSNLKKGIPPAAGQFQDSDCLKYIFTIDGKFSSYNPDPAHTTDGNMIFPKGQTGWFNEFINGRPTVWTKESIFYTDNASGGALEAIDYGKVTNIVANIQCGVEPGKSFIVQVMYLPINEDQYVNTSTDFKTNFIYERVVITLGDAPKAGENTGDYHFLKNAQVNSWSNVDNRVKISFQTEFSQTLKDKFDCLDSDNLNYLIFITAQNDTAIP